VRPVAAQGTQQRDGVDHRVPSHGTASDRYLSVHAVVAKAPAHFVAIPRIDFADAAFNVVSTFAAVKILGWPPSFRALDRR
jgi:hypothetical protein